VIDLVTASESCDAYGLRAWTGVAVDEGVGLIAIVEVSDARGRPVCRFELFLDASVRRTAPVWPADDRQAAAILQAEALGRARAAVQGGTLTELHGHRFEAGA